MYFVAPSVDLAIWHLLPLETAETDALHRENSHSDTSLELMILLHCLIAEMCFQSKCVDEMTIAHT